MSEPDKASPEAAAAMREVMKHLHARAHFRYPVDGQWSEFEKTFHATLDEIFGPDDPNSAQNRWVRRLRRHGLIR